MGYRKRKQEVRARVTDEAYRMFNNKVRQSGLTKTEVLEQLIKKLKIINYKQYRAIYTELKREGNNLNQITKAINSGRFIASIEVLVQLERTEEKLRETMKMFNSTK